MSSQSSYRVAIFTLAIGALLSPAFAASNGKVIYNFTGQNDGGGPATQITFAPNGDAYGTTVTGGDFGCGTVFQLAPIGGDWQETTLYSFTCGADGKNPYGGVTSDPVGNLYGTTVAGGNGGACAGDGCGTVYALTKSGNSWSEAVIYNFTGGNDGFGPGGRVVFDNEGNLFGTTPDGGQYSMGVVYELSLTGNGSWQQTVIHAFTGGNDGGVGSLGSLLYVEGEFYGVTELGGAYGAGTVFSLSRKSDTWTFATVHQFQGQPHAAFPYGGLITDGNAQFFGTTYFGGAYGQGTVFLLEVAGGKVRERVLHSFTGGNDGSNPTSTPTFDNAGNLYVTTSSGGSGGCQCGTIFKLSFTKGEIKGTALHSFQGPDGAFPNYGLTFNGNLYGSTPVGGVHNQGVIFTFTP